MSIQLALIRAAALLVPREQRVEWFAEWRSELWYVTHSPAGKRGAIPFCLGAFKDALWLRRNCPALRAHSVFRFESPLQCGLFLAVLAAISVFLAFRLPEARHQILPSPYRHALLLQRPIVVHLLMIVLAVLILPATTSLRLGEYAGAASRTRARRWIFLGIKFALIVPIVFCGTLDLAPIIASGGIQPHAMLIGYILAFRWALIDQRARCPVCLRLLSNPVRIGRPSQTFLGWYGTELICARGHGLLHVPEIPTSCYSTPRWLSLDHSWSSLFS